MAAEDPGTSETTTWRSVWAGPAVAAVAVPLALVATWFAGVSFQDPSQAVMRRCALVATCVAILVLLDIVVRAGLRSWTLRPSLAALRSVRREHWSGRRVAAVAGALVGFYVTYLAYRNVKSVVPLLRPGQLFDPQLAEFDRGLFGGNDPAALLHSLLGTGTAAELLSAGYVTFWYFVPISLALALVFCRPRAGVFYAVALSINWALGAASYLLLPAVGPIYATPGDFTDLASTDASNLQGVLLRQREAFVLDPTAAGAHQGIGAFASLHISIVFTAAVAGHMLGLDRRLRIGLWFMFAVTMLATIYLGWHYVADDLAGMVIALTALALARVVTGFEPRTARRLRLPTPPIPEPSHHLPAPRALETPVVETSSGTDAR